MCACCFHPQGSTVNMNINQRMYDNAFGGINDKPQRLGVVLLVGELIVHFWIDQLTQRGKKYYRIAGKFGGLAVYLCNRQIKIHI